MPGKYQYNQSLSRMPSAAVDNGKLIDRTPTEAIARRAARRRMRSRRPDERRRERHLIRQLARAAIAILLWAGPGSAAHKGYDAAGWLKDLEQIRATLTTKYANLD